MRQAASIYQKPTGFILQAQAPVGRAWLAAEPVLHLPITASAEELGKALLTVIRSEQAQAPWPADWQEFGKQNLRRLGLKTLRQLHSDCKYCHVTLEDGNAQIVPSANEKTSFAHLAEQTLVVEDVRPAAMGTAVLRALALSR